MNLSNTLCRCSVLSLLLLGAIGLAGCNQTPQNQKKVSSIGPKHVVTTFTVIQDMAQNVAGDKVVVKSITKPGAEIHGYEPTPLDIIKAQSADLVLSNGFGLERWFKKFMSEVRDVEKVTLTVGIEPINIVVGPYGGRPNPHSWMSTKNALIYVENIRKALVDLDPLNADTYNANAAAYSKKLKQVDKKLRKVLSRIPESKRWLVTSEGAFSYLARDHNMKELYLWPVNAEQMGTPQQIQKVIDTINKYHIPVVFSESTISPKPMLQVVNETGAHYGGVLYVDSLTDEKGPASTYLEMLEYDANIIAQGFKNGYENK